MKKAERQSCNLISGPTNQLKKHELHYLNLTFKEVLHSGIHTHNKYKHQRKENML